MTRDGAMAGLAALHAVMPLLRCPHCGTGLTLDDRVVRCQRGHGFDVGRPGYVSLLAGGGGAPGDTAAVVGARERFLAAGHYDPLGRAVASAAVAALDPAVAGCVADLGAGTGWYLRQALDRLPGRRGIALDSSAPALRRAARAHARAAAVGCDVWQGLPLRAGVAALVLDVFAPRNPAEIARVLAPGGALVVVTPAARHLGEIREPLGLLGTEPSKQERIEATLGPLLVAGDRCAHEHTAAVPHGDLLALVQMGPNAYHTDPAELALRVARLPDPVDVTVSVTVRTFHKRQTGA